MACNQDGIKSQSAAGALGAGDTEVLQMQARAGEKLYDEKPAVSPDELQESATIVASVEQAEKDDVRQSFVINYDKQGYIPCENPEAAIRMAKETGGAAYIYDEAHHPANSPRSPVAIFDEGGRLMMTRQDWGGRVQEVIRGN